MLAVYCYLQGSIADLSLLGWHRVLLYANIDVSEKYAAYVIRVKNFLCYTTGRLNKQREMSATVQLSSD
jgi:hypothetical protein